MYASHVVLGVNKAKANKKTIQLKKDKKTTVMDTYDYLLWVTNGWGMTRPLPEEEKWLFQSKGNIKAMIYNSDIILCLIKIS